MLASEIPTAPMLSEISKDLDAKGNAKRNKDLQKTKLCVYNLQGKCGLGNNCPFAHTTSEVRTVPNLTKTQLCTKFMNGKCTNPNCNYAHGEAELVKPPSFKKKHCVWFKQGKCRNGKSCGFIHDEEPEHPEIQTEPRKIGPRGPPGLIAADDASTDVPSSMSQVETDVSMMSTTTMPEEHLFRMMAGRGSAPLQQQVQSMSLAIGDLQAKIAQLQGRNEAASQVSDMQNAINQLSQQCQSMDSRMHSKQQPITPMTAPPPAQSSPPAQSPQPSASMTQLPPGLQPLSNNARPRVSASRQTVVGTCDTSNDISNAGLPTLPKKVRPSAQSSTVSRFATDHRPVKAPTKGLSEFQMRALPCVFIVILMIMLEVYIRD